MQIEIVSNLTVLKFFVSRRAYEKCVMIDIISINNTVESEQLFQFWDFVCNSVDNSTYTNRFAVQIFYSQ